VQGAEKSASRTQGVRYVGFYKNGKRLGPLRAIGTAPAAVANKVILQRQPRQGVSAPLLQVSSSLPHLHAIVAPFRSCAPRHRTIPRQPASGLFDQQNIAPCRPV